MAVNDTFRTYFGDGVTRDFAIPFTYQRTTEVVVKRKNGSVSYTFVNNQMIRLSAPLAVGDVLTVQRVTDIDSPAVVWKNGSGTTGTQLNAMAQQLLWAMQEARDTANRGLFRLPSGEYDFVNSRAANVADPIDPKDAVNKRWAETAMNSQLASATNAATQANAARDVSLNVEASVKTIRDDLVDRHEDVIVRSDSVIEKYQEVVDFAAQVSADKTAVHNDRLAVEAVNVTNITTNANEAKAARDKAQAWADTPMDTPVEPGKYSAKHWAQKAQAAVAMAASGIPVVPAGNLQATDVQAALYELDNEKAPVSHTHTTAQVTGLDTALATILPKDDLIGFVFDYAGETLPAGFVWCDGRNLSRTTYAKLFAKIGTVHGAGDGTTTFAVPDLRGRVVAGRDNMGGVAAGRLTQAGSGVDGTAIGKSGGSEFPQAHTHTFSDTTDSQGAHTHTFSDTTSSAGSHSHDGGTVYFSAVDGDSSDRHFRVGSSSTGRFSAAPNAMATTSAGSHTHSVSGTTSSNGAHTHSVSGTTSSYGAGASGNVQPTYVLNKVIYAGV